MRSCGLGVGSHGFTSTFNELSRCFILQFPHLENSVIKAVLPTSQICCEGRWEKKRKIKYLKASERILRSQKSNRRAVS